MQSNQDMDYNYRQFMIFSVTELPNVNFNEILETSTDRSIFAIRPTLSRFHGLFNDYRRPYYHQFWRTITDFNVLIQRTDYLYKDTIKSLIIQIIFIPRYAPRPSTTDVQRRTSFLKSVLLRERDSNPRGQLAVGYEPTEIPLLTPRDVVD